MLNGNTIAGFINAFYFRKNIQPTGPNAKAGKSLKQLPAESRQMSLTRMWLYRFFFCPHAGDVFLLCHDACNSNRANNGQVARNISTMPVLIFHHGVLSPSPSKPLPLFAADDVYS